MGKNGVSRIWWWLIPTTVILGGLGYYWYTKTGPEVEKVLVTREISPVEKTDPSGGVRATGARPMEQPAVKSFPIDEKGLSKESPGAETSPIEKEDLLQEARNATYGQIERLFEADKGDLFKKASADKVYCDLIEQYIIDFFGYLDTEKYIKRLDLKTDTYSYFKKLLKKLSVRPPFPAGEGSTPTVMVSNVFYFFRVLDRKDLRLFKKTVVNERDTMEINLEMFYRWLMLGKQCPNPGDIRPSFEVMYRYAGFFLNTIGGRACLFRRSSSLRVLVNYYCLLIVYQADRLGKNRYGIDIFPHIQPLKDDIRHHPDFEFQEKYISSLNRIENYYLQKR